MASSEQFAGVKGRNFEERYRQADAAVEDWLRQINIDGSLNTEKYSNFALELAKRYKSHTDQKSLAGLLRDYYDLVNGSTREVNMFDAAPTSEKLTREEAIKKVFDIGQLRTI